MSGPYTPGWGGILQWYRRLWRQAAPDLVRTQPADARHRFVDIHGVTRW